MCYPPTISAHESKNHARNLNPKSVPYDFNRVQLTSNSSGYVFITCLYYMDLGDIIETLDDSNKNRYYLFILDMTTSTLVRSMVENRWEDNGSWLRVL